MQGLGDPILNGGGGFSQRLKPEGNFIVHRPAEDLVIGVLENVPDDPRNFP